jgi:hypothetical protein
MALLVSLCQHHLLHERQSHDDDSPSLRTIACSNAAAVLFDYPLDDGQTEPRTAAAPREERLKHPRQVGGVESRASIRDGVGQASVSPQASLGSFDHHTSSRWRMLDGVLEKVLEHLHQALPIHAGQPDVSASRRNNVDVLAPGQWGAQA